jgi:hypothetical protein
MNIYRQFLVTLNRQDSLTTNNFFNFRPNMRKWRKAFLKIAVYARKGFFFFTAYGILALLALGLRLPTVSVPQRWIGQYVRKLGVPYNPHILW